MSIKTATIDAIKALFPKTLDNANALVRELLVANSAATAADARKRKAKEAVIKAGLVEKEYRPGEVEAFRDTQFVLTAVTNEPSQRLDQAVLREALHKAGLSTAKIDKAFVEALVDNKPATRYVVAEL